MDRLSPFIFAVTAAIVTPAEAGVLDKWQAHIAEASQRFGIPTRWIEVVIKVESNGDPRAVSPKGAMGLMQLMPATWDELRDQYGFDASPFDPRANILAGTAYLKAMYDRFGYPGLFAAYNAGPGRYEKHLRTGRPLPAETRAYVARIEKMLAWGAHIAHDGAIVSLSNARDLVKIVSGSRLIFPLSATGNRDRGEDNSAESSELFVPLSTRKSDDR
jgi:hypothetical protein